MSEVFKVKCSNSKVRPPTTREGKKLKTAQRQGYWTTGAVICDVVDKKCVWWERNVLFCIGDNCIAPGCTLREQCNVL